MDRGRRVDRPWYLWKILTRYWLFFSGLKIARRSGEEELLSELRDLSAPPGEPQERLPQAEISERERREAVRRHKRELKEKGKKP